MEDCAENIQINTAAPDVEPERAGPAKRRQLTNVLKFGEKP
jgi:hypothetical protein